VSVSLARRLLTQTDIGADLVSRALRESLRSQTSLIEALLRQAPELFGVLEPFLAGDGVGRAVVQDRELSARIPPGLGERLLAFPSRVLPDGRVEVLAADPLDPHVRQELEVHLGRPVAVEAASLAGILAVAGLRAPPKNTTERPLVRVSASMPPPTDLAIPLVRRSERPVKGRVSTSPGLGRRGATPLPRSNGRSPAPHGSAPEAGATASGASATPPLRVRPTPAEVEGRLVAAAHPEGVAEVIAWALGPGSLVFAVRPDQLTLLAAVPRGFERDVSEPIVLQRGGRHLLDLVLDRGEHDGPLAGGPENAPLERWLRAGERIYGATIPVRQRPVLILLVPVGSEPDAVARYGQRIAAAAGKALELLIVRRKRTLHS
jgi:hypothetical protein